jgi:tight adherence protein C
METIIPISIFVFVVLGGISAYWILSSQSSTANKRLKDLRKQEEGEAPAVSESRVVKMAERVAEPINRIAPPSVSGSSSLHKRLMHAGYRAPNAPVIYHAIQLLCLVSFPLITVIVLVMLGRALDQSLIWLGIGCGSGYLLPRYILNSKVKKRQQRLQWGMADALDLLVVSVEAGLGVNQAMVRVASEMKSVHPEISIEFELVNAEIRVGREREEAWRNLAERTGVEDLRGLCAMLIQSDRFGTSIARAIRVYSESLRTKRRQRAEQAAEKAAVKLLLPLALFLFPTLFIAMLGPAFLQLMDNFANR